MDRKQLILVCAAATSSLIMLDTNIVAVALPTIARDFHAPFAAVEWVISSYLVTFAALLLPSGSLADLHGRRRMVMVGLVLFLVASAACGLATSVLLLEIGRAVQGIGGSILLTSAMSIIAATFSLAERPKAYAFWGTCIGLAITLGPIAGGVITGLFGWRWAFLINVPLCFVFLAGVRAFVPESRDPLAGRLDVWGVVTLSTGLFALTGALIDGNHAGWGSRPILLCIAGAVVALGAFLAIESIQSRPMLDLQLFRQRMLVGAACAQFGYGASAQVMVFFLPIYLQGAFGLAPMTAGFAMLPFAAPLFLAPRTAASVLHGWSHRSALMLGLGITALGNLFLMLVAHSGSYALVAAAMLVAGAGTGILNPETAKATQAQIPPARAGMAAGIGATIRFISLLLGVAILGSVMAAAGFATLALVAVGISLLALTGVGVFMRQPPTAGVPDDTFIVQSSEGVLREQTISPR